MHILVNLACFLPIATSAAPLDEWASLAETVVMRGMAIAPAKKAPKPSRVFEVGQGAKYRTIGAVPWNELLPGDEVRIRWRPEPYRERIVVAVRGTAEKRIRVVGVPGPKGERPAISGAKAVTDPKFALSYAPLEGSGLVTVWHTTASGDKVRPGYIDFVGLDVSGATADQDEKNFTGADGKTKPWGEHACGFYLLEFDDVRIVGCKVSDCGTGIFTGDSQPCTDLLIEDCDVSGCGKIGSYLCHNLYVQCVRPIYRNNRFGRVRPGTSGGNLKDRSADVLIEGNRIEGGARMIDLSSWQNETAGREKAKNATRSIIRNNLIINRKGDAVALVYIEGRGKGDSIEFEHNTIVVRRDQSEFYYVRWFHNENLASSAVTAKRNLIDCTAATDGAEPAEFRVFDSKGSMSLDSNWTRLPVSKFTQGSADAVKGWDTLVVAKVAPGFEDEKDFVLKEGAAAKDYGRRLQTAKEGVK